MRGAVMLVSLVVLIAPALAGAQGAQGLPPAAHTTSSSQAAPAPAVDQARAPTRSRSLFGQAIAELTRSVDLRQDAKSTAAGAPAAPEAAPAREGQVATHDPGP